jgi:hypothetical protein
MHMTTAVKEVNVIDGGGGYGYGGGGGYGGWGVGIWFLVLFIIIIVACFWGREGHRTTENVIKDHANNLSTYQLATQTKLDFALGKLAVAEVRIGDTYQNTRDILNQQNAYQQYNIRELDRIDCDVRNAGREACDASYRAAENVKQHGDWHGFRTFDMVYPDPCRCRDGRDGGRFADGGSRVTDYNFGTQTGNQIGAGNRANQNSGIVAGV